MQENLQQLADKLGILTKFVDAGINRKEYYPPEKVIRFFAESFGYKAGSDAEINASLEKFSKKRWQKSLENIYVCEQGDIRLDIVVPVPLKIDDARINLKYQNTGSDFSIPLEVIITGEEKEIGKTIYSRLELLLKPIWKSDTTMPKSASAARNMQPVWPSPPNAAIPMKICKTINSGALPFSCIP